MKKITVLQSWRAIFIILICIEHMALNNKLNVLGAGGEGVSFFIVLSGFLTGYIYKNKMIECSFKSSRIFLINKLKKFYPLHILALVLFVSLQLLYLLKNYGINTDMILDTLVKAGLNALFLQVYIPVDGWYMNNINGVSWFLSTIVFCYLFSLSGLYIIKKISEKRKVPYLIAILLVAHITSILLFKDTKLNSYMLYVFPIFRFLEYFIAMIMGYYFREEFIVIKNRTVINLIEVMTVLLLVFNHLLIKSDFYSKNGNYNYITVFICSLMIVYVFSKEKGILSKILNNKILICIGNASFYIYIMHQVILKYVTTVIGWNNLGAFLSAVAIIIYTVVISKYYNKIFGTIVRPKNEY